MGKVRFDPVASQTLNELLPILYSKGYFATRAYAKAYVDEIISFCNSIPQRSAQLSQNIEYGNFYCRYQPNKHTTWYIFFDTKEEYCIIRHIMNNHSAEYADYLRE